MPIKEQEQFFALHDEFRARVMRDVEALRKERVPSLGALLKDGEERLARVKARIEGARRDREAAARSWDERIGRLEEDAKRIEAAIRDAQKHHQEKPTPAAGPKRSGGKTKK